MTPLERVLAFWAMANLHASEFLEGESLGGSTLFVDEVAAEGRSRSEARPTELPALESKVPLRYP